MRKMDKANLKEKEMSIFSSVLTKVADIATGGIADKAIDAVKEYFPPDLSPEQKANIELKMKNIELEYQRMVENALVEASESLNKRIAINEGTAKDLLALPIIGRILLFCRGAQRPIWGFGVLYMDYMVYSGAWSLKEGQEASAFWVINLLVLGFLFGERTVKNLTPLILGFMGRVGKT